MAIVWGVFSQVRTQTTDDQVKHGPDYLPRAAVIVVGQYKVLRPKNTTR